MFDLEIGRIVDWVCGGGFSSVALQLPEGLKSKAIDISDIITRETGASVFILGYPCYGACDLFVDYRKYAEALIHFGHSPIPSMGEDPNVMYVEVHTSIDIVPKLNAVLSELPQRIGLLATVQYVEMLPKVKSVLETSGRIATIGMGDTRICHPGQVLGCNCSSAISVQDEVDGFLFIGEGDFHPLATAFGVKKSLFVLNPVTGELRDVVDTRDRILRKRFASIENAKSAKDFLVIVCGKVGQNRMSTAQIICSKLRNNGRNAHIVIMDEITPNSLLPFKADAYVCTGCPRIAMDDSVRYQHPMLTVTEIDHVLGLRDWDDYRFDSI
ncbi:MAG: diphthamide biosynthesis enzyme Dph2 [Candidatus Methanogranum gryphiswaldense]|nr:MAG: diphthamide biosynthesis enzyme Dph2 [Candidatus Methanogranum sp. U3.2.1]